MARPWCFEYELDDFPGVEVAAHEFGIGLVFFQGHDRDMRICHDGFADGGEALEEVLGEDGGGARERLDEDDAVVGMFLVGIKALDADWHIDLETAGWGVVATAVSDSKITTAIEQVENTFATA